MDTSSQHVQADLVHPMLQQPLRTFMLPHLSPSALLALRQTCQGAQQCVDHDTAELWLNIALHMGVPLEQVPSDPWNMQAVHAALNQRAALGSRVRSWDVSSASPHGDLLDLFRSSIQLKLSWVWHRDYFEEENKSPSCRYLLVHDGIADRTPCYDSDTESGKWEIAFPSTASPPHPWFAVVDLTSGDAAVVPYSGSPQGHFHSNCFHAFSIDGEAHVLCGAYSNVQGQLNNRLHLYSLADMYLYSADGSDDEYQFDQVTYRGNDTNSLEESAIPAPDWQQEMMWQTELDHACMAGHGTLVAWQTGVCSFSVVDLVSHVEVVHQSYEGMASSPEPVITGLQWSSSGDHLALQLENAADGRAQLILMETETWQQIACCEYGAGFSMVWAPNKPSLAILDDRSVEVRHAQGMGGPVMQLSCSLPRRDRSGLKCRWDPEGRYLVVLCTYHRYDAGSATIWDTLTGDLLHPLPGDLMQSCYINSDSYWPEWRSQSLPHLPYDSQSKQELASAISNMSGSLQQCFIHDRLRLEPATLLILGQGDPTSKRYGYRWSHMSPNGSLVTTLLANTEDHPDLDPDLRAEFNSRSAHAFRHYCASSGREVDALLPIDGCIDVSSGSLQKSHPFLCAWLPGTTIYAAAALGCVYVVDGLHNRILKIWAADGDEAIAGDNLPRQRAPSTHEPEFGGLSWSPDGLYLAWLWSSDMKLHIVSFALEPLEDCQG